jgi:hypothetical protein
MGVPRQVEQLHSFKHVSNIPRHLFARNCRARQMGIQDISTYTSTVVCIPTVVARVFAMLPRYSKSDQILQNFPGTPVFLHEKWSRTGARQSICHLFFQCNAWQGHGRRLQWTHKGYKHLQTTESQLTSDVQDFQNLQEGKKLKHHESLIYCITLAWFRDIAYHEKPKSCMINHVSDWSRLIAHHCFEGEEGREKGLGWNG